MIVNQKRRIVYVNDILIQDQDLDHYAGQADRFPGVIRESGSIGLQNHTGDASFRSCCLTARRREPIFSRA